MLFFNYLISAEQKEKAVRIYLELESSMNEFYKKIGFCSSHCHNQKKSNHPFAAAGKEFIYTPGNIACCLESNIIGQQVCFDRNGLLDKQRREIFGPGKNNGRYQSIARICRYHSDEGCILETHRPPECISYACYRQKQHLKNDRGIRYDLLHDKITDSMHELANAKLKEKEILLLQKTIDRILKQV